VAWPLLWASDAGAVTLSGLRPAARAIPSPLAEQAADIVARERTFLNPPLFPEIRSLGIKPYCPPLAFPPNCRFQVMLHQAQRESSGCPSSEQSCQQCLWFWLPGQ